MLGARSGYRLTPGTTLGSWLIESPMARGGMGELYRVTHVGSGQPAALKVMTAEQATLDQAQRFLQEAHNLAAVVHPNVVRLWDWGREPGGALYLVTELLHGKTLFEVVQTEGRLPIEKALDICAEAASGLEAAHAAGFVHRDVKPANLFLTREGGLKVIDFGIAKPILGDAVMRKVAPTTEADVILGTVPYLAPEQLLGNAVDFRADVFALGVVAYELLAGESPWADQEGGLPPRGVVASRIVMVQPAPLTKRLVGFPEDVWFVLRRALEKQPKKRYSTMGEFATDLRETVARFLATRQSVGQAATAPNSGERSLKTLARMPQTRRPRKGGTMREINEEGLELDESLHELMAARPNPKGAPTTEPMQVVSKAARQPRAPIAATVRDGPQLAEQLLATHGPDSRGAPHRASLSSSPSSEAPRSSATGERSIARLAAFLFGSVAVAMAGGFAFDTLRHSLSARPALSVSAPPAETPPAADERNREPSAQPASVNEAAPASAGSASSTPPSSAGQPANHPGLSAGVGLAKPVAAPTATSGAGRSAPPAVPAASQAATSASSGSVPFILQNSPPSPTSSSKAPSKPGSASGGNPIDIWQP